MAWEVSRNLTVKGFAGFEVADEVLGLEFVRLPGSGCEARSILWTNQVGIGFKGPVSFNFHSIRSRV